MHGRAFPDYVEQVPMPTLAPGDIVVRDNILTHKPAAVRRAIERADAELRFLVAYSPDFNSLEMAFAKLKALPQEACPAHRRNPLRHHRPRHRRHHTCRVPELFCRRLRPRMIGKCSNREKGTQLVRQY